MNSYLLKAISGIFMAFLMLAAISNVTVFGQEAQRDDADEAKIENVQARRGKTDRLVGVWDVSVSIRVCQTGAIIRTFPSIGTFNADGTMLDTSSGIPQSLKTPGHGVWTPTEGSNFVFRFKSFSFDAAGNATGWTIITHYGQLNHSTDDYQSSGTAQVYNMSGILVLTGCSTTTATRFQ